MLITDSCIDYKYVLLSCSLSFLCEFYHIDSYLHLNELLTYKINVVVFKLVISYSVLAPMFFSMCVHILNIFTCICANIHEHMCEGLLSACACPHKAQH